MWAGCTHEPEVFRLGVIADAMMEVRGHNPVAVELLRWAFYAGKWPYSRLTIPGDLESRRVFGWAGRRRGGAPRDSVLREDQTLTPRKNP